MSGSKLRAQKQKKNHFQLRHKNCSWKSVSIRTAVPLESLQRRSGGRAWRAMSKVSVKIKWLKNKYDVDIMLDEPAEVLQTQVLPLHAPASRASARALARLSFLQRNSPLATCAHAALCPHGRAARQAEDYCRCETDQGGYRPQDHWPQGQAGNFLRSFPTPARKQEARASRGVTAPKHAPCHRAQTSVLGLRCCRRARSRAP